jgi:hypothetical protein
VNNAESGGPLLGKAGPQNENSDGMAALHHVIGEAQRLAFRATDAERREYIDDPHSTPGREKD